MAEKDQKLREWEDLSPKAKQLFEDPDFLAKILESGRKEKVAKIIESMTANCKTIALRTLNAVVIQRMLKKTPVPSEIIRTTRAALGNIACSFEFKSTEKK